jgi:DNA-binding NtrC family response regulator
MNHVLVVSGSSDGIPEIFSDIRTKSWKHSNWDSIFLETNHPGSADLLLLVGVPEPESALRLLRRRSGLQWSSRVVVVAPRDLDPSDLKLVSTVADDFILVPERPEVIRHRITRFLTPTAEIDRAYQSLIPALAKSNLVGQDPSFLQMAERIVQSAKYGFPVLITGETGTGKDLFARAIHFLSARRNQPFVPVDCGGIPDHLLENELFGHARGAYTDACGEQRGLAGVADKGTLFLDEIDSLSLASQAKLLRFLQDHRFKPLGSERHFHSDVKVIAASNRDLEECVTEKLFRADLFFRLNVLRLKLPPLRERREDIGLLARHFLTQDVPAGTYKELTPAALHRLNSYDWPGNVRELQNVIQRAIVFSQDSQIAGCDIVLPNQDSCSGSESFQAARREVLQRFERDYIGELLRRNHGNITWAAKEAGKERRAFGRLVKKYGAAPFCAPGQF